MGWRSSIYGSTWTLRSLTRPSSIKPSILRIPSDTPRVNGFHSSCETGVKGVRYVDCIVVWFCQEPKFLFYWYEPIAFLPFSLRSRRCLSSLFLWSRNFATMVTWRQASPLHYFLPGRSSHLVSSDLSVRNLWWKFQFQVTYYIIKK